MGKILGYLALGGIILLAVKEFKKVNDQKNPTIKK